MYRRYQTLNGFFCAAIALLLCCAGSVWAQPTAFTYQGKLTDAGNPANGNFDLQFKLFDTPTVATGAQQGAALVRNPTAASAGVFTVTLDFGASVFGGAERYLEIGVRPAGSASAYTVLAPRQPITSSPYAIQTINAQQLGGLPASRYLTSDASGNFGIGTAAPVQSLQVNGVTSMGPPGSVYGYLVNGAAPGPYPTLGFNAYGPNYLAGVLGFGSVFQYQNGDGSLIYYTGTLNSPGEPHDFIPRFTILRDGAVGIGTTNPGSARLQVEDAFGNAVFGNSGSGAGVVGGSTSGTGVYAGSTSGTGVYGFSTNYLGVWGKSTSFDGVRGETASPSAYAISGYNTGGGLGVYGDGGIVGVRGNTSSGRGVVGTSGSGSGVYGETSAANTATAGGVHGKSLGSGGIGVIGEANAGTAIGVFGTSTSPTGFGLYGRNNAGGRGLYLEGNAAQNLDTGGLVKAMVRTFQDGTMRKCYNGITNSSTGNCGIAITHFGPGVYSVDFGFSVTDRFVSLSARFNDAASAVNSAWRIGQFSVNAVEVNTYVAGHSCCEDAEFILILY